MDDLIERAVHEAKERSQGGVWRHSTDARYFIFCVGQDPVRIAAFLTWAFHEKVNVKPLIGKYEGVTERSFIANYKHFPAIEPFLKNEESILMLDRYDARDQPRARLVYQNGKEVQLGKLVAVTKEVALSCASWTYDPATNAYFITAE
jgi:hypothetical protein